MSDLDQPQGWYAVALAADLDPGTSAGTRLFGAELVVWRDAAGSAHVWEDRCPHRGMRLSFGFVRGDHIACLYHGWQYDVAGQCRYIPAHPDLAVSPMIRARTYVSLERLGLVWVAWGEEPGPPPDTGADGLTPLRSLYLDRPAAWVRAAFADAPEDGLASGLLRTALAGIPVLVAVQPLADDRCAAHFLIDRPSDAVTRSDRARAASACVAWRRSVEARSGERAAA
ncbi:Rieske 2Fe-2S domain-containing protein [Methylorubrum sp. POS3]|uniref:Rieske 2Fe-2S domain-containing protein n=1 Tax=Methylorubrum sp. POS3 TaxID=2998492 RepID=UPI00372A9C23